MNWLLLGVLLLSDPKPHCAVPFLGHFPNLLRPTPSFFRTKHTNVPPALSVQDPPCGFQLNPFQFVCCVSPLPPFFFGCVCLPAVAVAGKVFPPSLPTPGPGQRGSSESPTVGVCLCLLIKGRLCVSFVLVHYWIPRPGWDVRHGSR